MILREFLEQINEVLKSNMKKEVIRKGTVDYDTEKGRRVITEYEMKDIIRELDKENIINYIQIVRAVNLIFLGVEFKLKRKKSGMMSRWQYAERLTYSEISLNTNIPNQEHFLDMELSDIRKQYVDEINEEERLREEASKNKIESFKGKLSEFGITPNQFKELLRDYNNLDRDEKEEIK